MKRSFHKALTYRFFLLAIMPVLVISFVAHHYLYQSIEEDIDKTTKLLGLNIQTRVSQFLNKHIDVLDEIGHALTILEVERKDVARYLHRTAENNQSIESIFILDRQGMVLNAFHLNGDVVEAEDEMIDIDLSSLPIVKSLVRERKQAWSDSFRSTVTGNSAVYLGLAHEQYLILAAVDLSSINNTVQRLGEASNSRVILVDEKGVVLAHSEINMVLQRMNLSNYPTIRSVLNGHVGAISMEDEGVAYKGNAMQMPTSQWSLLVLNRSDEVLKPLQQMRLFILIAFAIVTLLSVMLIRNFSLQLSRPLRQLGNAIERLSHGEFNIDNHHSLSYQEIDGVIDRFEVMADVLKEREKNLKESKQQYQDLANLLPQTVFELDEHHHIRYMNKIGRELYGLDEHIAEANIPFCQILDERCVDIFHDAIADSESRREISGIELLTRQQDNTAVPVIIYANPIEYEGTYRGIRGVMFNISALKEAESRLRHRVNMEQALSVISSRLLRVNAEQVPDAVTQSLRELGHILDVERADIRYRIEEHLNVCCEWGVNGTQFVTHSHDDLFEHLVTSRSFQEAIEKDGVFVSSMATQKHESAVEQFLNELALSAFICVPVEKFGRVIGYLSFYVKEGSRISWSASDIGLIRVAAQLFSWAMERRDSENEMKLSAKVFEHSQEGIFITDADLTIVKVNQRFTEITGYTSAEALGQRPSFLSSGKHSQHYYQRMWRSIVENGHWEGEIWNRKKSGEIYPEWLSIAQVKDENDQTTHYVAVFFDITETKEAEQRLRFLSNYDVLSELPNKQLFRQRLELAIANAQRKNSKLAVLFLDVNRFKDINDSLGHDLGDSLIRELAERLRGSLRQTDMVARLGGDEFIFLLEEVGSPSDVLNIGRKIQEQFVLPFSIGGEEIFVTASMGITLFPDDGDNPDLLIRNADVAMYRAKEKAGNEPEFYAREMTETSYHRLTMESRLRRAIENEEFVLYLQPQIDIQSRKLIGAEALIRWQDPERGMVPPFSFIPIAEDTGLIQPITDWVVGETARIQRQWKGEFTSTPRIGINVSARDFRRNNLVELIDNVLSGSGLEAHELELELTESALMDSPEETVKVLSALKEMGVHLAVDDFGTGYSSLTYLKKFPIDRLKIDQSFVRDIMTDKDDAAIVESVIALSKAMRLEVVAEGVEEVGQLNFLQQKGCTYAQGYLFARPMPVDDFVSLMRKGDAGFAHTFPTKQ